MNTEVNTDKYDHEISLLNDFMLEGGQKIVDIFGYVSHEFGDPVFKLTRIMLDTAVALDVEGEHDLPYINHDGVLTQVPNTEIVK